MWEEEESENGGVGDFVIGSLAMQLQEWGKDFDGVPTAAKEERDKSKCWFHFVDFNIDRKNIRPVVSQPPQALLDYK